MQSANGNLAPEHQRHKTHTAPSPNAASRIRFPLVECRAVKNKKPGQGDSLLILRKAKSSSDNQGEVSEDVRVFTAVSWRILNYYPVKGSRSLREGIPKHGKLIKCSPS